MTRLIERAMAAQGKRLPQSAYSSRALLMKRTMEDFLAFMGLETKPRGTPERKHANIVNGMTRGERKQAMRNFTMTLIETGRTFKGKLAMAPELAA